MAKSEEELKSLLMKVKEESKKASLKLNIHKTKIMASGPITSWQKWQIDGETWKQWQILSSWAPKSLQTVTAAINTLASWKKSHENPGQCIKKQRYHLADKGLYSQSYGFSSSHLQM